MAGLGTDEQLRSFFRALQDYVNKRHMKSRDQLVRSNTDDANSLEKNILDPKDEDEAESQTVLIGDKAVKPKNLHLNKEQERDDNRDHHPTPPVVGIKKAQQKEARNFGISRSPLWKDGIIPYDIDSNSFGSRYGQALDLVENTAANISKTTCVQWRRKTAEDTFFVKIIGNDNGCYSYVGNIEKTGGQELNLGEGCLDEYIVLHEMHHAMGGLHEQQRDKRKYFVKVNWGNVKTQYNDQYALSQHTKNNEIYDYASILQYHLTAFSSNYKPTMSIPDRDLEYLISESKYALDFYDMAEVNREYNCPSASCTLSCQNEGFRMQAVGQTTCKCHCPSGLKGATCEELDTDAACGKIISLSNGGSEEIKMSTYSSGSMCTWLVKGESDSIIKATVTAIDLPFSSQDDCYHWLEFRDYLIGDKGKELCGKSTTAKIYTQAQIGQVSPFMIRFNAKKSHTPGSGFTVRVEALKSGCMSSPCKTGSLCTEGPGDGTYTCACQNGLSGTNCDQFKAPSYNLCNHEDDFGTCVFGEDLSADIRWSFNTRLCDWRGCGSGALTRGSGYQFLTLTPYYDSVPWNYGSKAAIKTSAHFTAVDRCLSFDYALGNYVEGDRLTELNVYMEGTGKAKTKLKTYKTTTDYNWRTETVSIEAVENLVITIEGVIGPQLVGVDNISLRPGLCTNTPCNPNPCLNSGTCDDSSPPTGSKYGCTCPAGFTGDRCETPSNTNGCTGHSCQNGATCVMDSTRTDGYRCECDTGFTGDKCENKATTNACNGHSCQNGATCVVDSTRTDGYRCECDTGFTGDKCENKVTANACNGHSCQNGATCIVDSTRTDGYRCECDTGFTGDKCENKVTTNACNGHSCQNGATCVVDSTRTDGYRCECDTGFTGDKCEKRTHCADTPCKNGGICTSGNVTFSCQCSIEYTGPTCDTLVTPDHCSPYPCENGGICNSNSTGFYCTCPLAYTGRTCDILMETNPCDPSPCQNGGSCVSFDSAFYCMCVSGYLGDVCQRHDNDSDACASYPCQNGGSCVVTPNGENPYTCDCPRGYSGRNCEGRTCKFERSYDSACFLNTEETAWYRNMDHNSGVAAFEGNHYLYLDPSSHDRDYFFDDDVVFEAGIHCLSFAYYMSGSDVEELSVHTFVSSYDEQFKLTGSQGDVWKKAQVNLHLDRNTFIVFYGVQKQPSWWSWFSESDSLLAIDDVTLTPQPCPGTFDKRSKGHRDTEDRH
uniref:Metalloendopeptidase n=1 Tax=Crassostrea virginica TaxID=6565 RepID=A0A8B8BU83_CRAVI|nr:neurogenic locus notch homolog protein 1-like isoform X2 [Crassostrea virginica]